VTLKHIEKDWGYDDFEPLENDLNQDEMVEGTYVKTCLKFYKEFTKHIEINFKSQESSQEPIKFRKDLVRVYFYL
jgi:hypothetical protein